MPHFRRFLQTSTRGSFFLRWTIVRFSKLCANLSFTLPKQIMHSISSTAHNNTVIKTGTGVVQGGSRKASFR